MNGSVGQSTPAQLLYLEAERRGLIERAGGLEWLHGHEMDTAGFELATLPPGPCGFPGCSNSSTRLMSVHGGGMTGSVCYPDRFCDQHDSDKSGRRGRVFARLAQGRWQLD